MLTSYCDETNTHEGAPFTGVGGYVFDDDGQRRFTEEWAKVLLPLRAHRINYFRAADCYYGAPPFSALSGDERRGLFRDLISLTRATAKFGMVARINDESFTTAVRRNKLESFTGSKYTACALRSLAFIARWTEETKFDGSVVYLFESGNEHEGEADHMMKQIRDDPRLGEKFHYEHHGFYPKTSALPLQAADLWVWLYQKWSKDRTQRALLLDLIAEPSRIPHWEEDITHLSLSVLALGNMADGIKSNRKYEIQAGPIRTYSF